MSGGLAAPLIGLGASVGAMFGVLGGGVAVIRLCLLCGLRFIVFAMIDVVMADVVHFFGFHCCSMVCAGLVSYKLKSRIGDISDFRFQKLQGSGMSCPLRIDDSKFICEIECSFDALCRHVCHDCCGRVGTTQEHTDAH